MAKTLHFRNAAAYQRYLAFKHMHVPTSRRAKQTKVEIAGRPHKVKHGR